jgi:ADP-heptose:LPS heptosyltransferase
MIKTTTIAHFRNGIGNFVLYTPALRALASMDASGQIDICTDADWKDGRRESVIDLAERLPFVKDVFLKSDSFEKTYKTWFYSSWSTHDGAREIFSAMKPYKEEPWNQNKTHESDFYFDIVQKHYGYKGWKPTQLIVPADDPIIKSDKIKIVLCDGSFGHISVFKKWKRFQDLAIAIKRYFGDSVTLIKIGHKQELSDVTADIDFVNKLSMSQTAAVIQQADLMITTDTGNMHIADALGTPLLVLWGGSSLDKNKPINAQNKVLHLGMKCQPCILTGEYKQCQTNGCLDNITVNEVMYHVRKFLTEGKFNG